MTKNPFMAATPGQVIAPSVAGIGGILRCEECGWLQELGNVALCLDSGWPSHCGYTMRWWTQRQINAGEMPRLGAS